ncbi:ExbD/TolR family protein [Dyella jiangningensis]|uniref:Biopolymer transporter ExbD n=1 Tax=Dyella jiangningensis TaxID=1379159 RepID=A0A328P9W7_9GAMM|nr:biopolymer transporter ExbD [Dyella jiangningensis]RAO77552.1 biopolymer transporter ExbD [Dyella jiangningensis]
MAFSARVSAVPLAQINVTPLVDVLLVLLVIMMITSPVLTHKLKLDLPQPGKTTRVETPQAIRLAIHADGSMYWNDTPVNPAMLEAQLALTTHGASPPALQIDPADGASYQVVAAVIASAKRQGMDKIDFVAAR